MLSMKPPDGMDGPPSSRGSKPRRSRTTTTATATITAGIEDDQRSASRPGQHGEHVGVDAGGGT